MMSTKSRPQIHEIPYSTFFFFQRLLLSWLCVCVVVFSLSQNLLLVTTRTGKVNYPNIWLNLLRLTFFIPSFLLIGLLPYLFIVDCFDFLSIFDNYFELRFTFIVTTSTCSISELNGIDWFQIKSYYWIDFDILMNLFSNTRFPFGITIPNNSIGKHPFCNSWVGFAEANTVIDDNVRSIHISFQFINMNVKKKLKVHPFAITQQIKMKKMISKKTASMLRKKQIMQDVVQKWDQKLDQM